MCVAETDTVIEIYKGKGIMDPLRRDSKVIQPSLFLSRSFFFFLTDTASDFIHPVNIEHLICVEHFPKQSR
jgi:hypothetical protein